MREPDAVDSHLFTHVLWAEHLSWAPTTLYFAPSQNIFTRGEFVAYEWATLIYLQESASNFLIFHEHHSPFLFHLVSQILSSRLVAVFAFQTPRLTFLNPLSRKSSKTVNWPDGTSLKIVSLSGVRLFRAISSYYEVPTTSLQPCVTCHGLNACVLRAQWKSPGRTCTRCRI